MVDAVVSEIECLFTECKEPYQAGPSPPGPCQVGSFIPTGFSMTYDCVCAPPYGKDGGTQQLKGSLGWIQDYTGYTCQICPPGEGRNPVTGYCEACSVGFTQAADGTCSQVYTCSADERYLSNNTGCYSCPAGQTFNDELNGCHCAPKPYQVYDKAFNTCGCADPVTTYDNGQACIAKKPCFEPGTKFSTVTGLCERQCDNPNQIYQAGAEFPCKFCEAGTENIDNACKPVCGADQVRIAGACDSCPQGTERGEGNTCAPQCKPGSQPTPKFSPAVGSLVSSGYASSNIQNLDISKGAHIGLTPMSPIRGRRTGTMVPIVQTDDKCVKCNENEEYITASSTGDEKNASITQGYCFACAPGEFSKGGTDKCRKPLYFHVLPGLTPGARAALVSTKPPLTGVPIGAQTEPPKPGDINSKAKAPKLDLPSLKIGSDPSKIIDRRGVSTAKPGVKAPDATGSRGTVEGDYQTFTPGVQGDVKKLRTRGQKEKPKESYQTYTPRVQSGDKKTGTGIGAITTSRSSRGITTTAPKLTAPTLSTNPNQNRPHLPPPPPPSPGGSRR